MTSLEINEKVADSNSLLCKRLLTCQKPYKQRVFMVGPESSTGAEIEVCVWGEGANLNTRKPPT